VVDDGDSRAEILIVVKPGDLAPYRARAGCLIVVGTPGAKYFAGGADEVIVPGEPEILFRRVRAFVERLDLLARLDRLNERVAALEAGLADCAHDVRSPLQAVIGNAELLARDTSLTPSQRECAAAAARQGLRAMQLAERILESARLRQRTALDVSAFDLGKLVETVVEQGQPAARQHGVTLVANPPARSLELRADSELLRRLFDNLVANAVRVSPRGAQVEVSAWRASPKTVRLAVKDKGDGIAASELPRLVAGLGPGRGLRIARDIADARWLREVSRTLKTACEVRAVPVSAAKLGNKRTDLVLLDPAGKGKKLETLRSEAKDAQVPVIELPSETAAARLARTLAQFAL
jgi:signal transduction histidine kinase